MGLLLANGCASIYHTHQRPNTIPTISLKQLPLEKAIDQLNEMIRQVAPNEPVPYITIDTSPIKVTRLGAELNLDEEMNKLEALHLATRPCGGGSITIQAVGISISNACKIVRSVTGMIRIPSPQGEIWRYTPPLLEFKVYDVSSEVMFELRKDGLDCLSNARFCRISDDAFIWNESSMMITPAGQILLIGTPEEHVHFSNLIRKYTPKPKSAVENQ